MIPIDKERCQAEKSNERLLVRIVADFEILTYQIT